MLLSIDITRIGPSLVPMSTGKGGYSSAYSLGCGALPSAFGPIYDVPTDQIVSGGNWISVLQFTPNGSIDNPSPISFKVVNLTHTFCILPTTAASFFRNDDEEALLPIFNEDASPSKFGRMYLYPNFAESAFFTPNSSSTVRYKPMIGGTLGFEGTLTLPSGGRSTHGLMPFLATPFADAITVTVPQAYIGEALFRLTTHLEIIVPDPVSSSDAASARNAPVFLALPLSLLSVQTTPIYVAGLMGGTTPTPSLVSLAPGSSVIVPMNRFRNTRMSTATHNGTNTAMLFQHGFTTSTSQVSTDRKSVV